MTDEDRVVLAVPGSVDYLDVIRGVVAHEARRRGFTFDGIEDACLAVDEACVLLLAHVDPGGVWLSVGAWTDDDRVGMELRLTAEIGSLTWAPPDLQGDVRWQVLVTLVDHAEMILEQDRSGLILRQHIR